jgi:Amt family ammonium transporter
MIVSWIHRRPTILGTVTGAVVGLVAITPAAGFVPPLAGIPIGAAAAVISYYGMVLLKIKLGFDDSLDVFACHGLGGIWGALATGIFATLATNPVGADGLIAGNGLQVLKQLLGVVTVGAFAFGVTWVLGKLVDMTIGLRVGQTEETVGLDLSQHGERAYGGLLR